MHCFAPQTFYVHSSMVNFSLGLWVRLRHCPIYTNSVELRKAKFIFFPFVSLFSQESSIFHPLLYLREHNHMKLVTKINSLEYLPDCLNPLPRYAHE